MQYPREWESLTFIPSCLHPFMDEIEAFCNVRCAFLSARSFQSA